MVLSAWRARSPQLNFGVMRQHTPMKYKVIKSAAHNLGHSFTSAMNYGPDDYVMSYLVRAALASGQEELQVDLLSGVAGPPALLDGPLVASVARYREWLPKLVASHSVRPEAVVAAGMTLRIGIQRASDDIGFRGHVEVPYECVVTLTDDRGKEHVGGTRGWWSAHRDGPPPLVREWPHPRTSAAPRARPRGTRPWWKFWARAA